MAANVKDTVLKQSVAELVILGDGLHSLLGSANASGDAIPKMKSHFPLVRQLLLQNTYWRNEDKGLVERQAALQAFGPEIEQVAKDLISKDVPAWPATSTLLGRWKVWSEALTAGSQGKGVE